MKDELLLKDRALSATSDGISITDACVPDHPLIYINPAFERLTGYSAKEILGKNPRFLQCSDTDSRSVQMIRESLKANQACEVELLNLRKDGTPFWNRFSMTPIRNRQNVVTHHIGVHTDITVRKELEASIRRSRDELAKANRILEDDLAAAARLQQSLLPPRICRSDRLRTAWRFEPLSHLSGDMLNLVPLDETHIGFYVLDVSGHSVPAALLTVTLSRWLSSSRGNSCLFDSIPGKALSYTISPPADVLKKLNGLFPFDSGNLQFFTLIYGIYAIDTGILRYSSSGHPSPIFIPADRSAESLPSSGFPIGFGKDQVYREMKISMKKGDRILFYTDGIIDAFDHREEDFGTGRLLELMERSRKQESELVLSTVLDEVKHWSHSGTLQDDATMLMIEVN